MVGSFFPYLVGLGYVSLFILLGVFLRSKVKLFQQLLIPSSIIAGVLGFICINLGILVVPNADSWVALTPSCFGTIVFHLFAISFVAIGLLGSAKTKSSADHSKVVWRGSVWISLIFVMTYSLQSILGYSIFSFWQDFDHTGADSIIGYLFGTGFSQGPGQTISYGTIWESAPYAIQNAVNIGLTFSALGFFSATLVGIPLARYGLRNGWGTVNTCRELPNDFIKGMVDDRTQSAAHCVTHSANIDTFAYHLAMIFCIYLAAYFFAIFWMRTMPPVIAPIGIGFIFFWGWIIAKVIRSTCSKLNLDSIFDGATVRRLTGLCVDFMTASVFMSIQFKAIQSMLVPILIVVGIGTAFTAFNVMWFGRRCPELGFERALYTFGMCTGTTATGLLLIRIVDPEFQTTLAEEAGMSTWIYLTAATPILYFGLPFAAIEGYPTFWIFVASAVVPLILLKVLGFINAPYVGAACVENEETVKA